MLSFLKEVKNGISENDKDALAITLATSIGSWVAQIAIKRMYTKMVIEKRESVETD